MKGFSAFILFTGLLGAQAHATGIWSEKNVTGTWGRLDFRLYVPLTGVQTLTGLIVGLHGCHQTAEDFAAITRLSSLADKAGVAILLPEQSVARNPQRCWNWFLPVNQARYGMEPSMIMSAVKTTGEHLHFDRRKVFVVGLSSGGIMANVLGSCYPDVFSGIAIHSGIEFGEPAMPQDIGDGHMRCPVVASSVSGGEAYACSGLLPHALPRMILFQGDADQRVFPCNSNSVFEQWVTMENLAGTRTSEDQAQKTSGSVPNGYSFRVRSLDSAGGWKARQYLIHEMAHAWSGGPGGFFASDPKGPDATNIIWSFFNEK